jgi:hypothetical protein
LGRKAWIRDDPYGNLPHADTAITALRSFVAQSREALDFLDVEIRSG